jgi:hypothetical protein
MTKMTKIKVSYQFNQTNSDSFDSYHSIDFELLDKNYIKSNYKVGATCRVVAEGEA